MTLAGDIVSNSAYYSLVAVGGTEKAPVTGALLGAAAGLGAVFIPGRLGLGDAPSGRTPQTKAMTIAWYTLGGLAAGITYKFLSRQHQ